MALLTAKLEKAAGAERSKINKYALAVALIFVVALSIRLYLAFQTSNFSNEAYFNLRQIEHIRETGLPFFHDSLGFGGRDITFMPLFHYIVAFFSLFMPVWVAAKLMPNVLACTLIIIMYFIAKFITKNKEAALFAAFVSAFIPVFFSKTLNNISEFSLIIPLLFLSFYFFLRIKEERRFVIYYMLCLFVLTLTHQTVVVLLLGLLIYLVFVKLENLEESKAEMEITLFSIFLLVWLNFLFFKKALLAHGVYVIWQNIPTEILNNYFSNISILEAVYKIGVIPFALGIYVIYKTIFQEKQRHLYILMGFSMAVALLLWLRLIQLDLGLVYLGAVLTLLFAKYYVAFFNVVGKSNVAKYRKVFIAAFILIFALTSIYPSIKYGIDEIKNAPSDKEMAALKWINANSAYGDVVLASVDEGNLIAYAAGRKTVVDSNFIMVNDARQRYLDVSTMYNSRYSVEALQLINKYDIKYIYLSDNTRKNFGIDELRYAESNCLPIEYNDGVTIYKAVCRTEEVI